MSAYSRVILPSKPRKHTQLRLAGTQFGFSIAAFLATLMIAALVLLLLAAGSLYLFSYGGWERHGFTNRLLSLLIVFIYMYCFQLFEKAMVRKHFMGEEGDDLEAKAQPAPKEWKRWLCHRIYLGSDGKVSLS